MTQVTITAPNPAYDGTSAGVKFSEGKATIEVPRQRAALEYFQRHRFGISEDVPAPKGEDPDLAVAAQEVPGPLTPSGEPAPAAAPKGKGKQGAAEVPAAPGEPADVAGEGPVGAQHNVGHDGADPGNVGTPTTPEPDATI